MSPGLLFWSSCASPKIESLSRVRMTPAFLDGGVLNAVGQEFIMRDVGAGSLFLFYLRSVDSKDEIVLSTWDRLELYYLLRSVISGCISQCC